MGLTLVGLGTCGEDISLSAINAIKKADKVFLRTEKTPSANYLKENGIPFKSFDDLYESCRSFDALKNRMTAEIKRAVKAGENVVFAVDGAVSEDLTCAELMRVKGTLLIEGTSKAGKAIALCGLSGKGWTAVSAYEKSLGNFSYPLVVFDLDSKLTASEWKIRLFDRVGEETPVYLIIGGEVKKLPLYEIDNFDGFDYSTILVIEGAELTEKERFELNDLYDILYILRSPDGCPWDSVQTPLTIRKNLIEEAYEAVDAINSGDDDKMLEEIGDVLMQVAFHTVFAEERGAFDRTDVISELCKKLITRHTHVFGKDSAKDDASALELWDKNKQKEKGFSGASDYVSAIPSSFPACMRAEKTFKRAKKSGVKFDLSKDVIAEMLAELPAASDKEAFAGKLLFLVTAYVFASGVSAEEALAGFVDTFLKKLEVVEKDFLKAGRKFEKVDIDGEYDRIEKS